MAAASASCDTSVRTKVASPPAAADELHRLVPVRLVELGGHDLGALGGEHLGRHPAHAAAGPGDDRDLVLEAHRSIRQPRSR